MELNDVDCDVDLSLFHRDDMPANIFVAGELVLLRVGLPLPMPSRPRRRGSRSLLSLSLPLSIL